MKKLFSIFKSVWLTLSVVLCLLYFVAAFRLWGIFQELRIMQNLTHSFDLTRNDRYLNLVSKYDVNEGRLQYFSQTKNFTIIPARINCRTTKNSNFAKSPQPTIFVVIKSRPYEAFQRDAIRNTYGKFFKNRLLFVVGRAEFPDDEDALLLESSLHGDILQADFLDTYYNLSYKSLSILQWINDSCPFEDFYVQADSDALLFPENLRLFAKKNRLKKRHIFGLCWHRATVRREGKWRVPETRYSFNSFPDYCSGAAFVMTGDVPNLLLENLSDSSQYISIDDAFFSGILAEKSARPISRVTVPGILFHEDLPKNCPCQKLLAIFEYKSADLLRNAWTKFRIAQAECL